MQSDTAPTTTPATFTHTIRPAVTPPLNPRSRLYGVESPYMPGWVSGITERVGDMAIAAAVKRDAKADTAELIVSAGFSQAADGAPIEGPGYSLTTMRMRPHSMRELARALLDAAHDIETNPARTLLANGTSKAAA